MEGDNVRLTEADPEVLAEPAVQRGEVEDVTEDGGVEDLDTDVPVEEGRNDTGDE
jgi:hypothetical protein